MLNIVDSEHLKNKYGRVSGLLGMLKIVDSELDSTSIG